MLSCLTCRIWYPKPSEPPEAEEDDGDAMNIDNKILTVDMSPVIIVDPNHYEETLLQATVTVTYDSSNKQAPVLCGVRSRCGMVDADIIARCMSFASKRSVEMDAALALAQKQLQKK